MNIVAIIPARGGSKGVPGKNIRTLAGMPLIAHSIVQALRSELINEVYVSTDDDEIASVAREYGARVVSRPAALADDTASSESALLHGLEFIEEESGCAPDLAVFMQCTSPIREAHDLDESIRAFRANGADSLLSVVENHRFIWHEEAGQMRSLNYDSANRPRRQDMEPQYMENGSFYIFKVPEFLNCKNRLFGRITRHVMCAESAYEIDEEHDFTVIEALMSALEKLG